MKIFKISFNDINGGSIRCYATHKENKKYDNKEDSNFIYGVQQKEFDLLLDTSKPYDDFQTRIEKVEKRITQFIGFFKKAGK